MYDMVDMQIMLPLQNLYINCEVPEVIISLFKVSSMFVQRLQCEFI